MSKVDNLRRKRWVFEMVLDLYSKGSGAVGRGR